MILRLIRLDGREERSIFLPEPLVRNLAGEERGSGCAWCGAVYGNPHRADRLQPCPLGEAVRDLDASKAARVAIQEQLLDNQGEVRPPLGRLRRLSKQPWYIVLLFCLGALFFLVLFLLSFR